MVRLKNLYCQTGKSIFENLYYSSKTKRLNSFCPFERKTFEKNLNYEDLIGDKLTKKCLKQYLFILVKLLLVTEFSFSLFFFLRGSNMLIWLLNECLLNVVSCTS